MVTDSITVGMPLADFIAQYQQQPFELIQGKRVVLVPNVSGHQWTARQLFRRLDQFLGTAPLGEVLWETPFVLTDSPTWVTGSRTPDLAFYTASRWASYTAATPDWRSKPTILVPDLVVEVVSPNDLYTEIEAKVDGYLADGVQMVWVIDSQRRKAVIHRADSDQQTTIRETGLLDGGDLLPGFTVALKTLFE
jgi:Uma2 family endonuclease